MSDRENLLTIKQAAKVIGRTPDNISYLIQYKRINRYDTEGNLIKRMTKKRTNHIRILREELLNYFNERYTRIELERREKLGEYNRELAFDGLPERERTKHVHRLHPYKGKFIPQLVEYFLKRNFHEGQFILDPFVGSATTLVQACEMGINSVGIDISPFNCMISEVKIKKYDIDKLEKELKNILFSTMKFSAANFYDYEREIKDFISEYNQTVLPTLEHKSESKSESSKIFAKRIETSFKSWLKTKRDKLADMKIRKPIKSLFGDNHEYIITSEYLKKWFSERSLQELLFYRNQIENYTNEDIMKIILTRATRSVRLVPHYDLASPKEPMMNAYYCFKHKQICYPIQKAVGKLDFYTRDTLRRIKEFSKLRTDAKTIVIQDDSRYTKLKNYLDNYMLESKLDGIFTSPPYVGNIDYHEQHRYAYELLGMDRFDDKEIGPLSKGKTKKAQRAYVEDIAMVLRNLRKYMKEDAKIFFVANDKCNLYPTIAEKAGMKIVTEHLRPVSNRTERDKQFYSETIFEMKYI